MRHDYISNLVVRYFLFWSRMHYALHRLDLCGTYHFCTNCCCRRRANFCLRVPVHVHGAHNVKTVFNWTSMGTSIELWWWAFYFCYIIVVVDVGQCKADEFKLQHVRSTSTSTSEKYRIAHIPMTTQTHQHYVYLETQTLAISPLLTSLQPS